MRLRLGRTWSDSRGLGSLGFVDFGPGVAELDGSVEDRLFGGRVGVDGEVADSFELVLGSRWGGGDAGFGDGLRRDDQRQGIQLGGEIRVGGFVAGGREE